MSNQAIDLNNIPRCKVVSTSNPEEYEKVSNDLTASGWGCASLETKIHYDESAMKFKFAFLAIFVKKGIVS